MKAFETAIGVHHAVHQSIDEWMRLWENRVAGVAVFLIVRECLRDARCALCHHPPNLVDGHRPQLIFGQAGIGVDAHIVAMDVAEPRKRVILRQPSHHPATISTSIKGLR